MSTAVAFDGVSASRGPRRVLHDVSLAVARAGPDESNKGVEAADAVVVMVNALRKLARG